MEEELMDLSSLQFNGTLNNFDPDNIMSSEVVLITLVIDKSYSVATFGSELKKCLTDYINEMKNSHHASKILVQTILFGEKVEIENGYRPISEIQDFNFKINGSGTALYDGVLVAMTNSLDYQNSLRDSGLDCKNIVFVITDGCDNSSSHRPDEVKKLHEKLMTEEINMGSFSSILVGVGKSNESYFTEAKEDMGILNIKTITDSAKDIRSVIGMLSASTSSVAGGGAVIF